ncbi:MAG: histidinol-phosphatase [Ignavibacteriaceae bacterium]|nr:histidinol-phosphatase [Ignavibacteriaceae bacterium]
MNYKNEFEPFLRLLADESGKIIRKYFRTGVLTETKQDDSPVTIADRSAEEKLREMIMREFPEHGILGEEFGIHNGGAEWQWILDPIDGTKSFICGTVTFGTLIALTKNGKPVLGVINQPVLNEFLIGDNQTAKLNGISVRVRETKMLEDSVLLTTDHLNIAKYRNLQSFENLMRQVKIYRNWGDCYGYYLLATGYADIMIDPIMHLWDTMAVIPVIRGAGGVITDYYGGSAETGDSVIAASSGLHQKVLKVLNPDI